MVAGRSKQVFKQWLKDRPKEWREGIDVVAMDGFSGFKTASAEELPDAVEVMDPFHVVKLAGDALDEVRRRVQQETTGHRGRAKTNVFEPLSRIANRDYLDGQGRCREAVFGSTCVTIRCVPSRHRGH
jgi:transposase